MSLINLLLRDLEGRRKVKNLQHATNPVTAPPAACSAGWRWFWLVLLGISISGLLWVSLKVWPVWLPGGTVTLIRPAESAVADTRAETVRLPAVFLRPDSPRLSRPADESRLTTRAENPAEPPLTFAAAAGSAATQVEPVASTRLAPQAEITEKKRPPVVPIRIVEPKAPDVPTVGTFLAAKGGAKDVSLLKFGVVEGSDSVRLMFEFVKLPDYQIISDKQNTSVVTVLFFAAGKGARLEIPTFRGPLLKTLELAAGQPDLRLTVEMATPSLLQAYSLPVDADHGERLLVELGVDQGYQARTPGAAFTTAAGQGQSARSSGDDSEEQAEVLLRKAVRYLEQGNAGAAKIQFTKALELTPGNVALRQQLVELWIKDQQLEKAENLLLSGLVLAPQDPALRTRYSRMLLERNQLTEALALMLTKPIPDLPMQPDYHALLAALEQESGLFANAATRYRELLQVRPAQAEWWLLLAIAYEQLNDVKLASSAYRQALEKTGLSTEHRQFSLERLERLEN